MMRTDRRKSQRGILQLPVVELDKTKCENGIIVNLSSRGLCYYKNFTDVKLNGSLVFLSFSIYDEPSPVNITGKILHQHIINDKIVTGIRFCVLSDYAIKAIHKQLQRSAF